MNKRKYTDQERYQRHLEAVRRNYKKRMAARSYDVLTKSVRVSRNGSDEAKRILARKDLNVTVSYAGENVLVISFAQNDNVYRTFNLSIPEEK